MWSPRAAAARRACACPSIYESCKAVPRTPIPIKTTLKVTARWTVATAIRLTSLRRVRQVARPAVRLASTIKRTARSEEHTSELQSRLHLVCRLLLEKKKKIHEKTET